MLIHRYECQPIVKIIKAVFWGKLDVVNSISAYNGKIKTRDYVGNMQFHAKMRKQCNLLLRTPFHVQPLSQFYPIFLEQNRELHLCNGILIRLNAFKSLQTKILTSGRL